MTQCEKIVKYIEEFGYITAWEAMKDLGVMRLASRIYDLKKTGYNIKKETVSNKNRYGETVYYAKYSFERG